MCYDGTIPLFFGLILVAPAPEFVATVTRSLHPLPYHIYGYRFQLVGPADFSHRVDEQSGQIHAVLPQFGCLVVPRECVVVIVPAFTQG